MSADAGAPPPRSRSRVVLRLLAVIVAVAFVALLGYGLLAQAPNTGIDDTLAQGQAAPAPGFELPVLQPGRPGATLQARLRRPLSDGRVSLAELRGSPVVLNFWASWCDPCREEAPLLERAWRRQAQSGDILFVGLDMQDVREDAKAFLREFDVSYLNVRDTGKTVARHWQVSGIPETFFISAQGQIAGHVIGAVSADQLRSGMAAARSGRPVKARAGGDRRPAR